MSSEKELNVLLFEQLEIIEDALEEAKKENAVNTVAFLEKAKKRVERKLYQNPPVDY